MNQDNLLTLLKKIRYSCALVFLVVFSQLESVAQCISIPDSLLRNEDYLVDIGKIKQKNDSVFVPIVVTDTTRKPDSSIYILSVFTRGADKLMPVITDSFLYLNDYVVDAGKITILGNRLCSDSVNNQISTHHFGHYQYEKSAGEYLLKKFTPLYHEHYSFFDSLGFVGVEDSLNNVQHYYKSVNGDSLAVPLPPSSVKKLFPFELNRAIVADQNNFFHLYYYNDSKSLQQEVANASYIKVNSNFTVFAKFNDGGILLIKLDQNFPFKPLNTKSYESGYNFIGSSSKYAIVRRGNMWYAVNTDLNETLLPIDATNLSLPKLFRNSTTAYIFKISHIDSITSYLVLDLYNIGAITVDTISNTRPLLPYLYMSSHKFVFMRPTTTELAFVPYVNQREKPIIKTMAGNFLNMKIMPLNTTKTGAVIIYESNSQSRADMIIRYAGQTGDISSKLYNESFDKWWSSYNNRFLITSKRNSNQRLETYGYDLYSLIPSDAVKPERFGGVSAKLIHLFFEDPCDSCRFYYKLDQYNSGQSIGLFEDDRCKLLRKSTTANMPSKNIRNSNKKRR